jgi:hypothetical protein
MTGNWPPEYVDHIDGNPSNNIWSNLRLVSAAENSYNRKRKYDSFTGIKGVIKDYRSDTWHVHMMIDGKVISKGPYYSYQSACKEYDHLAKEARGVYHRVDPPRVQRARFDDTDVTQAVDLFIRKESID